jgi:formylglycine-generating enzyme required for sulfatase activity
MASGGKGVTRLIRAAGLAEVVFWSAAATIMAAEEVTNSIGMNLAKILAGSFMMGGGAAAERDAKPAHKVTLRNDFSMIAYEVTNAQYEQFDPAHKERRGQPLHHRLHTLRSARCCTPRAERLSRPPRTVSPRTNSPW